MMAAIPEKKDISRCSGFFGRHPEETDGLTKCIGYEGKNQSVVFKFPGSISALYHGPAFRVGKRGCCPPSRGDLSRFLWEKNSDAALADGSDRGCIHLKWTETTDWFG
jgi:hypothetical protein